MPMVMNWKTPQNVKTKEDAEQYFRERGADVIVTQVRRVSSGKMNTTFDGDSGEILKAWRIMKDLEKAEILARRNPRVG
jgi:membrane carboxypeptidase/penicillin-binding protein PbpC